MTLTTTPFINQAFKTLELIPRLIKSNTFECLVFRFFDLFRTNPSINALPIYDALDIQYFKNNAGKCNPVDLLFTACHWLLLSHEKQTAKCSD